MGRDYIEVKTITPFKNRDVVEVKASGNFNKLFVVKINAVFEIAGKMIDRKNLPAPKGGKIKIGWSEIA